MRIMIVADTWSSFNKGSYSLAHDMLKKGYEVVCLLPETEEIDNELKNETGLRFYCIPLKRKKYIPVCLKFIMYIYMIKTILRPDKILLHLSKKTILSGIFLRLIKYTQLSVIINSLSLLKGWKNIYYRRIYKSILGLSENVFFTYQDDNDLGEKLKFECKDRALMLRGWGVDISYYKKMPLPKTDLVYMSMPKLCCHGVKCFIETAKIVREKYPKVRFILTGKFIEDSSVLSAMELDDACENKHIYYVEDIDDIRPFLEVCTIFVHPNVTEKEGHILEAEATGRPILASDHPANRSMMIEGYNGFLLPVNDAGRWADKIMLLLESQKLKERMSEYSYQLCCLKYDRSKINTLILERLEKSYFKLNI